MRKTVCELLSIKITKISFIKLIIFLIFISAIGHNLNHFCEHRNFIFNQYFLQTMLVIQFLVCRKVNLENKKIQNDLEIKEDTEIYKNFNEKNINFLSPLRRVFIAIPFLVLYIFSMFILGCIEYSVTGLFIGVLSSIVFYTGIQTYLKYVALLYFVYNLKKPNINHYSFYFPAMTDWIVKLAYQFSYIEKWFLILGLMYSGIYAVNIPQNAIIINNGIFFHTTSNMLFFITWGGIIIFFALAVPSFTLFSRYYIKKYIQQCKIMSIEKIEQKTMVFSSQVTSVDLNFIYLQISLIKEISSSEEYPLRYKHTFWKSVYTIIFSLLTILSPFLSIVNELLPKS